MFSSLFYKFKLKSYLNKRCVQRGYLNINKTKHILVCMECVDISDFNARAKIISKLLNGKAKYSILAYVTKPALEGEVLPDNSSQHLFFNDRLRFKLVPTDDLIHGIDTLFADVLINLEYEEKKVVDFISSISNATMRVGYSSKAEVAELMIDASNKVDDTLFITKVLQLMQHINA